MPVVLTSIRRDLAREDAGDWIAYPDWPGVEFLVRGLKCDDYLRARDDLLARLTVRKSRPEGVSASEATSEDGKLLAQYILRGWRGLTEEYNGEFALKLLGDPAWSPMVDAVRWCAAKLSEISVETTEEDVPEGETRGFVINKLEALAS